MGALHFPHVAYNMAITTCHLEDITDTLDHMGIQRGSLRSSEAPFFRIILRV